MSERFITPASWRAPALALVPMAVAALGAALDERLHLGYSNWRSACRAAGITFESLLLFTLELLPLALIGLALGFVILQFVGAALWFRTGGPRLALASHGGCALGMAAGVVVCTQLSSVPAMLATEMLVTVAAALLLSAPRQHARGCPASVLLPTQRPRSAY